jgi:hypothetical protein
MERPARPSPGRALLRVFEVSPFLSASHNLLILVSLTSRQQSPEQAPAAASATISHLNTEAPCSCAAWLCGLRLC